ncbi:MAG: Rab family GTPase [Promethearchaeota archaeon]
MGGSAGSGKTTFLTGSHFPYDDNQFFHIGVSFKIIDCLINNEDSFLLQVWDFKVMKEFQCLYPSFCQGAKGALLCFDVTNYNSFIDLHYWIEIIRNNSKNIPIILIGTKIDLNNRVVSDEEIQKMIKNYNIDGIFFSSINNNNQKLILKNLIKKLGYNSCINDFNIHLPEFDDGFRDFIKFFSFCPICHSRLHFNYLKNFYFSKNREMMKLKDKLLELIDTTSNFDEIYYNKINLGILCCECFKKLNLENLI